MKKKTTKISYESDADVLTWEIGSQKIDYAEEVGNFIVHFSGKNKPVLIEILDASKFLSKAGKLITKRLLRKNKKMSRSLATA
jgi:hypothetical protein